MELQYYHAVLCHLMDQKGIFHLRASIAKRELQHMYTTEASLKQILLHSQSPFKMPIKSLCTVLEMLLIEVDQLA